jgi:hypothetical protein
MKRKTNEIKDYCEGWRLQKTDIDQDSLETFEKRTLSASSPRTQKVVTTETFQFKPQVW